MACSIHLCEQTSLARLWPCALATVIWAGLRAASPIDVASLPPWCECFDLVIVRLWINRDPVVATVSNARRVSKMADRVIAPATIYVPATVQRCRIYRLNWRLRVVA
jgi:hypothetical protein